MTASVSLAEAATEAAELVAQRASLAEQLAVKSAEAEAARAELAAAKDTAASAQADTADAEAQAADATARADALQEQLAAKLCEISGLSAAFFCNSGLEANEGAIKIARKFGHDRGNTEPEIMVFERAFHGRTLGSIALTANAAYRGNANSPSWTGTSAAAACDSCHLAPPLTAEQVGRQYLSIVLDGIATDKEK